MWLLQGQNQQKTSSTVVIQQFGDTYLTRGLAHRMPFLQSQSAYTGKKKIKNQDWCSPLLLLLKFKDPFSHCNKGALTPLQQETIPPIFPSGLGRALLSENANMQLGGQVQSSPVLESH